jgi:hypothetical protein
VGTILVKDGTVQAGRGVEGIRVVWAAAEGDGVGLRLDQEAALGSETELVPLASDTALPTRSPHPSRV